VERLRCFDQTVASLDRESIGEMDEKRPIEIKRTVQSARLTSDGWMVTLEDGSSWRQVGTTSSAVDPRAGMEVTIRRAALGSYRLVLSPHAAFKVERVR
jgi:hypothetical protein